MNILILGDVFGPPGMKAVTEKLPSLIKVGSWNSQGTPSWKVVTVIPIIWNPIIARNIPIPAEIAIFKARGMELTIHSRTGNTLSRRKIMPDKKTIPRAVCQLCPIWPTTVYVKKAFNFL